MTARRPIFNHLVAPIVGGPVMHAEAKQMLDAYRAEVLAEAKIETVAWLAKKATEQKVWDAGVLASKVDRGAVRIFLSTGHYRDAMDAHRAEVRREVLDEAATELFRLADATEARVAEHYGPASGIGPGSAEMVREAARTVRGMLAGKDTREGESTTAAPDFFQPGRTYARQLHGSRIEFRVEHVATSPDASYRIAFGWRHYPGEGWMPSESDDLDGWTDATEVGEPRG